MPSSCCWPSFFLHLSLCMLVCRWSDVSSVPLLSLPPIILPPFHFLLHNRIFPQPIPKRKIHRLLIKFFCICRPLLIGNAGLMSPFNKFFVVIPKAAEPTNDPPRQMIADPCPVLLEAWAVLVAYSQDGCRCLFWRCMLNSGASLSTSPIPSILAHVLNTFETLPSDLARPVHFKLVSNWA